MSKLRLGFASTFGTCQNFFTWALAERFDLEVVPPGECDYLIFGDPNFGEEHYQYRNCKRILYTGENYRPTYHTHDHAMTFDHENSPRHYRLPLYVLEMHMYWNTGNAPGYLHLGNARSITEVPKKFCSFVQSNPNQPIRNNFVEHVNKYKTVDCGGKLFNNIGGPLPQDDAKRKMDFIRDRKFNIAFENGFFPGYATEKILDALYADTIPVYLGSTTIGRDFNTARFINCHDYTTLDEVIEVMKELEADDKKWLNKVNQPVWKDNIPPASTNINNLLDWWETFVE